MSPATRTGANLNSVIGGGGANSAGSCSPSPASLSEIRPIRGALRVHAAELTAGHVQDLAVHVVRERRGQEQNRLGRLLGLRRAPERDDGARKLAHLLRDAECHLLAAGCG